MGTCGLGARHLNQLFFHLYISMRVPLWQAHCSTFPVAAKATRTLSLWKPPNSTAHELLMRSSSIVSSKSAINTYGFFSVSATLLSDLSIEQPIF